MGYRHRARGVCGKPAEESGFTLKEPLAPIGVRRGRSQPHQDGLTACQRYFKNLKKCIVSAVVTVTVSTKCVLDECLVFVAERISCESPAVSIERIKLVVLCWMQTC
jgi:hypothetical protein